MGGKREGVREKKIISKHVITYRYIYIYIYPVTVYQVPGTRFHTDINSILSAYRIIRHLILVTFFHLRVGKSIFPSETAFASDGGMYMVVLLQYLLIARQRLMMPFLFTLAGAPQLFEAGVKPVTNFAKLHKLLEIRVGTKLLGGAQ